MITKRYYIGLVLYFIALFFYSVWSFSLTDPNLVLTSWSPYWSFQQQMWHLFFENHRLLANTFVLLTTALIGLYFFTIKNIKNLKLTKSKIFVALLFLVVPILFSYNALSHDVFNYIFNAKMVAVYQADPHTQVALDFANDDWTRFMHNTHTPAPYGKAWTYLSLIPFGLGFQKFTLTWLNFRLFSLFAFLATILILIKNKKTTPFSISLIAFSPLLLIESISNIHNDFWMLAPAVLSFTILDEVISKQKFSSRDITKVLLSLALIVLSIYIKVSTLAILPVWIVLFMAIILKSYYLLNHQIEAIITKFWPLLTSFLIFIPLLTLRSQQFHPWYLSWVMVWLPLFSRQKVSKQTDRISKYLIKFESVWEKSIIVLSFSSLFRYIPFLLAGEFNNQVIQSQKLISWIPFILTIFILIGFKLKQSRQAGL